VLFRSPFNARIDQDEDSQKIRSQEIEIRHEAKSVSKIRTIFVLFVLFRLRERIIYIICGKVFSSAGGSSINGLGGGGGGEGGGGGGGNVCVCVCVCVVCFSGAT